VYFAGGAIRYIVFLLLPLTLFAQNNEAELYVENQGLIFGIKHIHSKQIIVKNSHKEPFYILNETPFYADSSLVATISFIDKKEEHLNNLAKKGIPCKKTTITKVTNKEHNSKQTQSKYQKNNRPFKADRLLENSTFLVVNTTNKPIELKNKNSLLPKQTSINYVALTLIIISRKTTYPQLFQYRNSFKEGILTYRRPPPFLVV